MGSGGANHEAADRRKVVAAAAVVVPRKEASSYAQTSAELREAEKAVVVHHTGKSGIPLRIAVPLHHYAGVTVDIDANEVTAEMTCRVILAHEDRAFEILLFESHDDEDVLAEWRSWGRSLNLPLLIRTDVGDISASSRLGNLKISEPEARRASRMLMQRRFRFLRRRTTGHSEGMPIHADEREIIAPE